jgi:predicted nucleic acid-binding protein
MNNPLRCVIDASVGIKQFIPDPLSDKVKQLFSYLSQSNTEFFVPDLFYIESTNIIWKYVRAGLYSITDVPQDLAELKSLSLQRDPQRYRREFKRDLGSPAPTLWAIAYREKHELEAIAVR